MPVPTDFSEAGRLLQSGRPWGGLGGDGAAFALARACQGGRFLIVVDEEDRALRMLRALRFFHPRPERVWHFPADDTKPYDGFSPDPDCPRGRLLTLARMNSGRGDCVVVASVPSLMQCIPSGAVRRAGRVVLRPGEERDRDTTLRTLADSGYLAAPRVEAPGQMAVRGDVLDIWPQSRDQVVRVDWFDDEIESLRLVRRDSGRPGRSLKHLVIPAAREERLDGAALDRLHTELGRHVREQGRGVQLRRRVYEELRAGVRFSAIEDWLPALVEVEEPLDALGGLTPICWLPDDCHAAVRDHARTTQDRYRALDEEERPLVPPSERYASAERLAGLLDEAHAIHTITGDPQAADFGSIPPEGFAVQGGELGPLVSQLLGMAESECRVVLVVEDGTRAERLLQLFEPHGLHPKTLADPAAAERGRIGLVVGDLPQGFVARESGWAFLPTSALFGGGTRRRRRQERLHALFEASVQTLSQLRVDDAVVHKMHGVGRYRGMQRLPVKGVEQDFVKLEYRGGDLLFLPVTALAQLSRYTPASSDSKVSLDKLGGQTWAARKGKVRDSLLKMADELLRLYAKRENATRPPWPEAAEMYRAFVARFPFAETPDQANAIAAVQEDLSGDWPMDRLVCGDVGFGKTEVALRAAMRVVEGGGQVAVLCPTTVLAFQHVQRFRKRFEGFAVTVGMLSRFNDAETDKRVRAQLASGGLDVVVGTTSLLGRQLKYKKLGLMVVDEEHRFGVKQKDRLKRLRTEVDILSMSATPIPRTLRMAMSGLRQMSLMATPPAQRLAVRTTVAQLSEGRVRDAVRTELDRGGQCFIIHNRVQTIHRFADRLRQWLPGVRMGVAHGQMKETELEQVLVDFIERRYDVLVSTSIIESGIDLPNVNTMLVDRADLFGLSQLYQLRGRVGRSDVRANCLLLVPEDVTRDARKRLRVLVEHTRLGSGFHIAAADLELRGGGNLLGSAQSGNIDKVGYETWVALLREAVAESRGDLDREQIEPEIEVPVPAFIPDVLVKDPQRRLGWYRRLSQSHSPAEVDRTLDELEIEVGELPPETRNLGELISARLLCRDLGIVQCRWLRIRVELTLHPSSPLTRARLERIASKHPKRLKVEGADDNLCVSARFTPREAEHPFRYLRWVLARLRREDS